MTNSCLQGTAIIRWTERVTDMSAGQGIPLMLFAESGRTLMLSPAQHYFVALHSTMREGRVEAGVKASVRSIPAGFTYDTVIHAGAGPNATLVGWGDHLLGRTGKSRVDPYDDFVLSHLGRFIILDTRSPAAFPDFRTSGLGQAQSALWVPKNRRDVANPSRLAGRPRCTWS